LDADVNPPKSLLLAASGPVAQSLHAKKLAPLTGAALGLIESALVAVFIAVSVTVPPGPVFLLFFGPQLAKVSMFIATVLTGPLLVIDYFVIVPYVVVAIVGVIDPVVMMRASRAQYGRRQRGGQET
jgi:hypothetical protein